MYSSSSSDEGEIPDEKLPKESIPILNEKAEAADKQDQEEEKEMEKRESEVKMMDAEVSEKEKLLEMFK